MRFLYYILTLAVLLVGCKRTDMGGVQDSGTMTFNASLAGMVQSRAVSAIDFDTYGINIAGYHTQGKFAEAIAADATLVFPNIFDYDRADNQIPVPLVTKKNDKFTLSTVKWGLDQTSYLSYFAWTQGKTADAVNGIVNATKDNTTTGYPWIDVVNSSDYSKQVDIAAARHVDERNHRVISAVDLDFKHILSKVTLKFKSSAGAKVAISKMDLSYGADMIFNKGRYTFNTNPADSIGHFSGLSGYHTGKTSLGTSHALDNGAEVVVGDLLLIPQAVKQGFLSFDLTYAISSSTGSYTFNKQVLLPASELLSGTNHIYTVDIYGEQIIVHQSLVSDWIIDATPRLPFVPGPKGNLQLLLDGYDKPYQHVDGVWYWLDRSGYNRHCKLDGYKPELYNETDHSYRLDGLGTSKIIAPAFNSMTELTTDVVCEHAATGGIGGVDVMQIVNFRTIGAVNRKFTVQMSNNADGEIYFDCDEDKTSKGRLQYSVPGGYASFTNRTLWTFQKKDDGGVMNIYQNASLVASKTNYPAMQKLGVMDNNEIARGYNGKVFYVKVMAQTSPVKDVVKTYQACRAKYNIPIDETYLPTVKNGLVFCYDGRHAPKTIGSTKYWIDEIGKNDARIIGAVPYYNSTPAESYFEVPSGQTKNNYMKMIYSVNMYNDFTVEFVLKSNVNGSSQTPVYWGTDEDATFENRYLYMHIPYGRIYVDSPSDNRYSFDWPSGYGIQDKRKIVIRRKRGLQSEFFMSNNLIMSSQNPAAIIQNDDKDLARYARTDISNVECTTMAFGGYNWGGRFYAIRFYDRALTDAEMKQNYDFDVKTFSLTGK